MRGSEVIAMRLFDTDPNLSPPPVRLAQPLIAAFARSALCPDEHRRHASSTLPLLALFVSMSEELDSRGLPWHRLDADALMEASLECESEELGFLQDLLDLSAAFYGFLAEIGVLRQTEALPIRRRLSELSLGVALR